MKKIFIFLKSLWIKFAHALGFVNTRILLVIFFVLIMGIYSILRWPFNFLKSHGERKKSSYWKINDLNQNQSIDDLTHPF